MATKRKRRATPKAKPMKINWGIVGFIAVVILAISAWQISAKPQSEAASRYTNWPAVVRSLSASINKFNGEVSANWTEVGMGDPFRIDGYRILIQPRGGALETYDLNLNQTNTNLPKGAAYPTRYATVKSAGALKAASATVTVSPMIYHPELAPNSPAIGAAGNTASAIIEDL